MPAPSSTADGTAVASSATCSACTLRPLTSTSDVPGLQQLPFHISRIASVKPPELLQEGALKRGLVVLVRDVVRPVRDQEGHLQCR